MSRSVPIVGIQEQDCICNVPVSLYSGDW
jgi:hypothetical protein